MQHLGSFFFFCINLSSKKTIMDIALNKSNTALKLASHILVLLKFALFFSILFMGGFISMNLLGIAIQMAGLILYVLAFTSYNIRYFTFLPFPKTGAYIIMHGPYSVLRHPMFLAMLLITMPLSIEAFNTNLFILQGLFASIICILIYLEVYLMSHTDLDYKNYCKYTKSIVPFLL